MMIIGAYFEFPSNPFTEDVIHKNSDSFTWNFWKDDRLCKEYDWLLLVF